MIVGAFVAWIAVAAFVIPCAVNAIIRMDSDSKYRTVRVIPVGIGLVWMSGLFIKFPRLLSGHVEGAVELTGLLGTIAGGICLTHGLGFFIARERTWQIALIVALAAFVAGLWANLLGWL